MLNTIIEVDGVEYDVFKEFNFVSRRLQTGKVESKDEEVDVPYRNGSLIVRASDQPAFKNRKVQVQLIHVGKNPREDSANFENLVLGKKCKVYIGEPSEIDKMAADRYYWEGYIEVGELKSSGLRWYKSFTVNAYPYRMAADTELLYNGDGSEGADGWYNITFTAGDAPTGCKGYFKANNTSAASQAMAYDPDSIYKISGWHRVDAANDSAIVYFGLKPLDIDGYQIQRYNVRENTNRKFTLAQNLKNGDTKIYLNEDVSNWRTDEPIQYQLVAFFNYKDSKGNYYGNYTRNTYQYVYEADGINTSDNSITLRSAWTGGTYVKGTEVARTLDGGTNVYYYDGTFTNKDWKYFEQYVIAAKNVIGLNRLAYATSAEVRPDASTLQSNWAGLSFKKMPGKDVTVTTTATTVTIKNEGSLNIIPTFIGTDSATVTISDGTSSYSFNGEGEHKSANIILEAGKSTTLTLTSTDYTNVGITWREGKF